MKNILIVLVAVTVILIFTLVLLIQTERQLDDCRFECNHLQTKLSRLQELSDYVSILEQILSPQQLAELKAADAIIRHKRYREYEAVEQPLIGNNS